MWRTILLVSTLLMSAQISACGQIHYTRSPGYVPQASTYDDQDAKMRDLERRTQQLEYQDRRREQCALTQGC